MNRFDLTDFTFIIPIRIDSPEREENLNIVISYLYRSFSSTIMVLEADTIERFKAPGSVEKIFIKDDDPVFHHSRYRNYMIKTTTTDYIALWDADAIAPESQVIDSCRILRDGKSDLAFPYDGRYYHTFEKHKRRYQHTLDVDDLVDDKGHALLMHGIHSVGGAIMMSRQVYVDAGMENENFYGWGPEDYERVIRCEILGYKISRINGPLFHLYHPRGSTSNFYSNEININSRKEFLKICKMNQLELSGYVNSSEWPARKS